MRAMLSLRKHHPWFDQKNQHVYVRMSLDNGPKGTYVQPRP